MEHFAYYLLKSATWLTGFSLVYLLFLKQERFFILKRIYLISGIIVSLLFPLVSFHYSVELPLLQVFPQETMAASVPVIDPVQQGTAATQYNYLHILLFLYFAGVFLLAIRMLRHLKAISVIIKGAEIRNNGQVMIANVPGYLHTFSFFNYVFIGSAISRTETDEILNHETVHVRQKHWIDLMLAELIRLLQWANPFAWIYTRFVRENHEYLADRVALQKTSNPADYKATLLNQIFGSRIMSFSNSLSYSLNKKRFDMMENVITSPYRKLKILLILPVIALVFYAFASPEYHYSSPPDDPLAINQASAIIVKDIRGVVLREDGTAIEGVQILVAGTRTRITTDASGNFALTGIPEDASLVISYKGYLTQFLKADFSKPLTIRMQKDPDFREQPASRGEPLIVVDDVISTEPRIEVMRKLQDEIGIMKVLSAEDAMKKYGEKAKWGAMEIITRTKAKELGIQVPFRRKNPEDFPTFQGRNFVSFGDWAASHTEYPPESIASGSHGYATAEFTVEPDGRVTKVRSTLSPDRFTGEAIVQTILSSPKWEPAKNPEATEPFTTTVTVNFEMPGKVTTNNMPFVVVEQMPRYPGGEAQLLKYIAENTNYPDSAKIAGIQGRVIVRFVVGSDGKVGTVSVLKGIHPLLDNEAIRIVKTMPDFVPGYEGGKPVPVWYMVPITFTLK